MTSTHKAEIKRLKQESDEQFQQMQTEVQSSQQQNSMMSVMQKKLMDQLREKLEAARHENS